jgi:hypothetical protein
MVKKAFLLLICLFSLMVFISTLHGQGSKKTISLPSGDVIWDLNGEWDVIIENYGRWAHYGIYSNVFRITQTDSAFNGIRLKDNPPPSLGRAGTPSLQGELEKKGFKRVEIVNPLGNILPGKGQISEDGNKISVHVPEYARLTLTRK